MSVEITELCLLSLNLLLGLVCLSLALICLHAWWAKTVSILVSLKLERVVRALQPLSFVLLFILIAFWHFYVYFVFLAGS